AGTPPPAVSHPAARSPALPVVPQRSRPTPILCSTAHAGRLQRLRPQDPFEDPSEVLVVVEVDGQRALAARAAPERHLRPQLTLEGVLEPRRDRLRATVRGRLHAL